MSISETRDTCYHQLSLFVVQKHTKSDYWLCLFILLVITVIILQYIQLRVSLNATHLISYDGYAGNIYCNR